MKTVKKVPPMAAPTPAQAMNSGTSPQAFAYPAVTPKESMRGSSNKLPPAARHTGRGFSKTAK